MIHNSGGQPDQPMPGAFPITDECRDCAGTRHVFEISALKTPTGFTVTAREVNTEAHGYEFRAFSPANEYLALAAVRDKIRRTLAVRYLSEEHGPLTLTHEEMKGTIGCDPASRSCGVIVDGRFLTPAELGEILAQYEGWEFSLSIRGY